MIDPVIPVQCSFWLMAGGLHLKRQISSLHFLTKNKSALLKSVLSMENAVVEEIDDNIEVVE